MGKRFLKGRGRSEKNTATADHVSETIPEIKEEEAEKVAKRDAKQKYLYIAVNREGEVVLDENGEPFFQTAEEGSSLPWDGRVKKYTDSARTDPKLRVLLEQVPQGISGEEKRKAKEGIRNKAKEKLWEMAADRIEAAREKLGQSKEGTITSQKPESGVSEKIIQKDKEPTLVTNNSEKKVPKTVNDDVIKKVEEVGYQINRDFSDAVYDITKTIDTSNWSMLKKLRPLIEDQGRHTDERTRKYTEEAAHAVIQKTQKLSENIICCVNDNARTVGETRDELVSKVKGIGKSLKEIDESVDGIVCDLHKLDQLDEITELLRHKGLTMSMEIPPVNADEEDIVNLVRYSQRITQQLGYAARDLLRKQEAFRSQEKSNENEQKMMEQKNKKVYEEGVKEGKTQVIKALLSKYEDVDTLRKSEVDHVHVIWTLLEEMGVCIDGDGHFERGKTIEFTDANEIQKMMATYSGIDGAGRYKVVGTGLSFQGEVISAAKFRKIS